MAPVVAVAYSGGRDSTALLHATACAARGLGIDVVALHIHHGLQPEADDWLAGGMHACAQWAAQGLPVRWRSHRLTGRPARGQSVEEWARDGRYQALGRLAREVGADLVLLAHHRRDQAETFLLQALRGGGVRGLSAMGRARTSVNDSVTWVRPWLEQPREAIEAYLVRHGLASVDDPSNADERHDRNRLRLSVWPALTQAFPNAEAALGRAARWCQEAARVMEEVAREDLARCTRTRAGQGTALDLTRWQALSMDRRSLALRTWLRDETGVSPPAALTERLCAELPAPGPARWPAPAGELRRYRRALTFVRDVPTVSAAPDRPRPEASVSITRAGRYRLPGWGGVLVATRVRSGGVPIAWLAQLDLRERTGGEQFQAGLGRPPRSLKKQYQAAGVPAWERDHGPLVFSGGQLVFAPSLGVDARVIGLPGQPQLVLAWEDSGLSAQEYRENAPGKR